MAKKKRKTRAKKNEPVEEKTKFWPVVGAIVLFIVALLLLLGGFNTGGALPKDLFHVAYWLFGWGGYLTPLVLAYWGVHKLLHEDKRVPFYKAISIAVVLLFASSWLFTAFAGKTNNTYTGGHGGQVGAVIGKGVLALLDKLPASIIFAILTIVAFFFAFGISPKGLIALFQSDEEADGELGELKARAETGGFKLNEGVPVEHHPMSANRLSSLKDTAQKMTPIEDHEALTTASDPNWKFPGVDLLNQKQDKADAGNVEGNAKIIHDTFANFNIDVEMEGANIGPRVTQYTLRPPANVKLTKITTLENNLALDLAAQSIRMEAPIPGKRAVGIEVPNVKAATVRLSSIFLSREWQEASGNLMFAVGKDISGAPLIGNLDKMPHLLIAGQTGSGKSVMINTLLTSLLYKNSPSETSRAKAI
jgi:S-DNA-T family DNA segregation ATPase FtsK/SpoIIIE